MKYSMRIVATVMCVGFALAMSMSMGCEELGKAQFTVDHETEVIEVNLDDYLAQAQADGKVESWDSIPEGICITLEVEKLSEIFYALPNDVDLEEQDETGKVKQYKDRVQAVDIDELSYVVVENTLSFDIPGLELFIGDLGATKDDMVMVTTTAPLAKGEKDTWSVEINDAIMQQLAGRLEESMAFSFAYKAVADKKIELCPNDALGMVKLKAIVKITVTADAI
jgi:hypothetical protein